MGFGNITIVDFDTVSPSNLARTVLFHPRDIGRPKVEAAAEWVHEINPGINITPVKGDLRFDLTLSDFRKSDLVFGCLDSVNARWALNRRCLLANVEWIDGGISDYHGLVTRYSPSEGACYECTFSRQTWERFNRRYSCPFGLANDQVEGRVPTTAVTTSMIASLQVQQALFILHGKNSGLKPGQRLMVYLDPFLMVEDTLPYNPECLAHETIPSDIPIIPIEAAPTIGQAILAAKKEYPGIISIQLPFDLVVEFNCSSCGNREQVMKAKEKVPQSRSVCPICHSPREPLLASDIDLHSPLSMVSFSEIGALPGEIFSFSTGDDSVYIQIGS